ncbi:MAG: cupin domain-containing protein, partial [Candidatus Rokuibacteriota bacterium]
MSAVRYAPGEGGHHEAGPGSSVTIKAAGEHTGHSFYLGEAEIAPGFPGPPPHFHERLHDMFYVLEGTLTVRLGDEIHELARSSCSGRVARPIGVDVEDGAVAEVSARVHGHQPGHRLRRVD